MAETGYPQMTKQMREPAHSAGKHMKLLSIIPIMQALLRW